MGRALGITDRQMAELVTYRDSDAFDDRERLALDLAVAMSTTPAAVTEELRDRLRRTFTRGQVVELSAAIAWENHRARMNRALDIHPVGFSEGAFCVLPES